MVFNINAKTHPQVTYLKCGFQSYKASKILLWKIKIYTILQSYLCILLKDLYQKAIQS